MWSTWQSFRDVIGTDRDDFAVRALEVTAQTKELASPWVDDVDAAISAWSDYCTQNPRIRGNNADIDDEADK